MVNRHSAFAAILALLLLPFAVSAQSPHNNDGRHRNCTIYSKTIEHAPDLALARVNSIEVGTAINLPRVTFHFGIQDKKQFASGTLVQPFPQRAFVMTINWH